jgi:hypothetical protein
MGVLKYKLRNSTYILYSFHDSLVERQLAIRGDACSSPGKNNNLGLPPSQDENEGLYVIPSNKFSGAFRISGAFRK